MPKAKTPVRLAPDEQLMHAARRIAQLEARRRGTTRTLTAIDDELRVARRNLRALAQDIAGSNDELETPLVLEPAANVDREN